MGGWSAEVATLGLGVVLLATIVASLVLRAATTTGGHPVGRHLTLYELALLAGGPGRVSDTALAYLALSGAIEVRESTDRLVRVVRPETVPNIHPVEELVLAAIDPVGVRPEAAMGAGRHAARRHVDPLDGLVVDPRHRVLGNLIVVVGCGVAGLGAAWWIATTEAPSTGFVPLVALVAVVFAGWWGFGGHPRISGTGRATLEVSRAMYDDDLQIAAIGVTSLPAERAMHVIALYGRDVFTGGLSGLRKVMTGNPAPSLVVRSSLIPR
ncbi:hypothetical protein BH23ACT5_BH23ACT5_02470 [soil metagenome]